MVFTINTNKLDVVRGGSLSSPLPPSGVQARALDIVQRAGLLARPATYAMVFGFAAREATCDVTPSTEDGPLIVTHVMCPALFGGNTDWDISIEVGSRKLTSGRVSGADLFAAQPGVSSLTEQRGWIPLLAPIIVGRNETLSFTVTTAVGTTVNVGEGFLIAGYHISGGEGERLPPGKPEEVIDELGKEGVLWVIGLQYRAGSGQRSTPQEANTARDLIIERIVLNLSEDGAVLVDRVDLAAGNTALTPQGIPGTVIYDIQNEETSPLVFDGLRWPVVATARLRMDLRHGVGAGTMASARSTWICRSPRT